MKKTMGILLAVLLLSALAGCGVKQKLSDKVTEKITEGILEKAGGEDVDIDFDDGMINVKGEDGTEFSIGGDKWPKGGVAGQIPEFKKGKITAVINSKESCWIEIQDVEEKDYQHYVEALQDAGFKDGTNYADDQSQIFSAYKGEDILVTASYSSDKTMIIQVMISSE